MTVLIRKEMRFRYLTLLIFYVKERRRCSTRLLQRLGSVVYSRYNISPLAVRLGIADSLSDPSHCSASCYASQGYGYIYGHFWLPQVRAAGAPW